MFARGMPVEPVEIETGDDPLLEAFLAERIYEYNAAATGYRDAEVFRAARTGAAGAVEAGIYGFTWGGCCFVSYLWVEQSLRRRGIGSELLHALEAHARAKGCRLIVLSSHSFQAPEFYARHGYEALARIDDYPAGHADIVLTKRLEPPAR